MLRKGHIGFALIVYSFIAYYLFSIGQIGLAVIGFFIMIPFAMIPDKDHLIPGMKHRGQSHSIIAAVIFGFLLISPLILLMVFTAVVIPPMILMYIFGIAIIGFITHIIADFITKQGTYPFKPFSNIRLRFPITIQAENTYANIGFYITGWFMFIGSVMIGLGFIF